MELKDYQHRALEEIRRYLDLLAEWRAKADRYPDMEIDYPAKAWEKAGILRAYLRRKNGLGQPLPTFCLKVPTGGGKTLLAVKAIDFVNTLYRRQRMGLVLWIVPTTQIYRQTIQQLKDRDHPYRQHLDIASGGRTMIIEKSDRFSPQDIEENLVVLMLMLPSANRRTKETLKLFQDSGGFQDFFPAEDDIQRQNALLQRIPNLDTYEKVSGFWGRQIKTSLGNTLRLLSPLIILDEGHKAYSEGAQDTLRQFNPCLIAELSATPSQGSNVLVQITGRELHREEMIKLDLHVVNKASPDFKDAMLDAHNKRCLLEEKAREYDGNTGTYIRPICLIQVERTGRDQEGGRYIHSEQIRDYLIKQLSIPAEQIAVKTSEKDELKEVDDLGGLLSRNCPIRYIITKQALQEGWDCSFAYVLAILTNPSSRNALTQLVGRILRQPYARKTGVRDLDESYVFCFQLRADTLLNSIRDGFSQEGLGDLRGHIATDFEEGESRGGERQYAIREQFQSAASHTILPVFLVRNGDSWRPVSYEMDIASRIPWNAVDLTTVTSLTLSMYEEKDIEHIATLSQDARDVIQVKVPRVNHEGGIRLDPVFMTRQLTDIVPNPWQAHAFSSEVLDHLRRTGHDEAVITNNFVFLIEELRKCVSVEKDRLAEQIFRSMLENDELRFLIISQQFNWTFPKQISVTPTAKTLTREDHTPLQRSLFSFVNEDEFNDTEKTVAWYLENQTRLFFWYRNRVKRDYAIQGWRQHRIFPDFIFTTTDKLTESDYSRVFVVETKGLHLKDNNKTNYIKEIFKICTEQAVSRNIIDLGLEMKDKIIKFEVVAEDEWKAKLNEIIED